MKNCPKCNHPVIDSAKFCQKCGSAVAASKVESEPVNSNNTKLPPAPPPLKRKPPAKRVVEIDEVPPPKNETTEKKGKNPLLGVALLVVISLVFYGALSNDKKEEAPLSQAYVDSELTLPAAPLPPAEVPADTLSQAPSVGPAEAAKLHNSESKPIADSKVALHGYVSIYQAKEDGAVVTIGAGYQTQSDADSATFKTCQDRYPGKTCMKSGGGAYKCAAVGVGATSTWFHVGDNIDELKSGIITTCKEHGDNCVIAPENQLCSSW